MLFAAVFIFILVALIAWNGLILWYLKRYVLQGDSVHHQMLTAFITGNIIFIFSGLFMLARIPWQTFSLNSIGEAIGQFGNLFP